MGKISDPTRSDPIRSKYFRVRIGSGGEQNPIGWNCLNPIGSWSDRVSPDPTRKPDRAETKKFDKYKSQNTKYNYKYTRVHDTSLNQTISNSKSRIQNLQNTDHISDITDFTVSTVSHSHRLTDLHFTVIHKQFSNSQSIHLTATKQFSNFGSQTLTHSDTHHTSHCLTVSKTLTVTVTHK